MRKALSRFAVANHNGQRFHPSFDISLDTDLSLMHFLKRKDSWPMDRPYWESYVEIWVIIRAFSPGSVCLLEAGNETSASRKYCFYLGLRRSLFAWRGSWANPTREICPSRRK